MGIPTMGAVGGGSVPQGLDAFNQWMQSQMPQGPLPQTGPVADLPPQEMMLGQMPMSPGDISGLATGMRGAAGLAGRIRSGLGAGREMLENPGAAQRIGGLPGAAGGFADNAAGSIRGDVPMGGPPSTLGAADALPPLGGGGAMPTQMGTGDPALQQIMQQLPPEMMQQLGDLVTRGIPPQEALKAILGIP